MDYNQRNDEIRDNIERMRPDREAYADALATVDQFNAWLAATKSAWFWPTLAAALASKHGSTALSYEVSDEIIKSAVELVQLV